MTLQVLGRDAWGARAPKWRTTLNRSEGVFIHYNGGPVPADVLAGNQDAVALFLRSTQNYHMDRQGWPDIAYSFCVDSAGRCWTLRDWGTVGAHTLGYNELSHAIFLPLGGEQAPTEAQIATARAVIAEHDRRYGKGWVKGHQQVNQTSCPGGPTMAAIRAGGFDPYSNPTPKPPRPPGVDPTVKPVIMRRPTDGMISVFYPDTPFRIDLTSIEDVQKFKFFGAEDRGNADPWFWKISSKVKTG